MRFSTLIWLLSLAVRAMAQSTPSTITLCADPASINPCTSSQPLAITLSKPVILTAMVPQQATGRVTFYDGTTILGISTVFGGSASWAANFLPSGTRILQAIYWGDATFRPSTSNKLEIDVAADTVSSFTPGPISPFAVGTFPNPPVVGDFNNDGVLDIAILNQSFTGTLVPSLGTVGPSFLTVMLGDGNGGFIAASKVPAVQGSTIAVGDFNGDGNLDVAIPDGSQSVQIWLGNGKGSFTSASQVPAGQFPFQAAVGDFNLDGKPDLAVAGQSGQVTVLEGDGAGGFAPFPASTLSCGSICMDLAVGDFNGDGFPDLAVVDYGNGNQPGKVTIFSGDGRGGFTQYSSFPTGIAPYFVVSGDLNGDGLPDLVIANKGSNTVSVWLANVGPIQPVGVGNGPITLALGDFNGDGTLDLAVANTGDSSVSILLGGGNGGFTPFSQSPYPVGNFPFIVAGDFNRDGLLDFATANYKDGTVSVMKATTGLSIGLSAEGGLTVGQQGTYDLIVTNSGASPISGTVTVKFTVPDGLTPMTPSGVGWACSVDSQTATCLRKDSLPQGVPYPTIILPVTVGGAACPSANVSAVITNDSIVGSLSSSVSTPISQCVNVTVQSGPLVVNTSVTYSLIVRPAQGATPTALSVTDVLPAGLTPAPGSGGSGWNCAINPPLVVCSWPGPAMTAAYPTININVNVSAPACPNTTNVVQVQHDMTQLDVYPSSVAVHGCLSFSVLSAPSISSPSLSPLTFNSTLVKNPASATLQVTSIDTAVLEIGASLVQNAANGFSYAAPNCSTLGARATCQIQVNFLPSCPGQQSATLSVSTNYGNLYSIPLSGLAVPRTVSFTLGGQPLSNSSSNTVSPYPGGMVNPPPKPAVGVTFDPPPDSSCPQQPTIALTSFSNPAPGGLNWDVSFDSNTNLLTTGTVSGTITLTAQVAGANITATDGSGSVQLQVPASTGVVTGASIENKSSSSFEITVKGYSTPHDTVKPTTAVCFSFAAASGAQLQQPTTPPCALQQDILIWYQRSASISTGSQFTGTMVVPFNGNAAAIGQISLWVENSVTQANPNEKPCIATLDYQSGAYQTCK